MLTRRSLGLILYMIFGRCLFQSRAEVKYTTAEIEINLVGNLGRMFATYVVRCCFIGLCDALLVSCLVRYDVKAYVVSWLVVWRDIYGAYQKGCVWRGCVAIGFGTQFVGNLMKINVLV